jgi:outer membrane protein assembly factor BamB
LREVWYLQYSGAFDVACLPLVFGGRLFFKGPKNGRLTAAREGLKPEEIWIYDQVGTADLIHDGTLFTWVEEGRADVLDPDTEKLNGTIDCPTAQGALAVGTTLAGFSYQARRHSVYAVDLPTARLRWQVFLDDRITGLFAMDAKRLVLGRGESLVSAPSLEDGRELWRKASPTLTGKTPLKGVQAACMAQS